MLNSCFFVDIFYLCTLSLLYPVWPRGKLWNFALHGKL